MNYTLQQLEVLHQIAETGSVTRAAEQLFITQPAASIQLKKLQDQFELPLLEHVGRKVYLTDFGKEVAATASRILDELYAIHYRGLAHKGLLTGKLTVSVVSTGKYVMPYLLSPFMKVHQNLELQMEVTNKEQVVASLEQNRVDFALVSIVPEQPEVETMSLLSNELYLVGRPEWNRFPDQHSQPQLLENLPLIFREAGSGTRLVNEKFINDHQLKVKRRLELSSNEAVKQAVLAGLGCSIMPRIGIKHELATGELVIIPVKGLPLVTQWNLVWRKGKVFSPAANAFLMYLNSEKEFLLSRFTV